jgi:hypothetical protein
MNKLHKKIGTKVQNPTNIRVVGIKVDKETQKLMDEVIEQFNKSNL